MLYSFHDSHHFWHPYKIFMGSICQFPRYSPNPAKVMKVTFKLDHTLRQRCRQKACRGDSKTKSKSEVFNANCTSNELFASGISKIAFRIPLRKLSNDIPKMDIFNRKSFSHWRNYKFSGFCSHSILTVSFIPISKCCIQFSNFEHGSILCVIALFN